VAIVDTVIRVTTETDKGKTPSSFGERSGLPKRERIGNEIRRDATLTGSAPDVGRVCKLAGTAMR
jgi:hypothetical protein